MLDAVLDLHAQKQIVARGQIAPRCASGSAEGLTGLESNALFGNINGG